jgi:hypothetical protein
MTDTDDRPPIAFRRARVLGGSVIFLVGLLHLAYHSSYTLDDAYISFRYARNLARGAGLVYNPGEFIKGYSNTLYTFLMVIPEWFGYTPLWLAKSLGLFSFVGLFWLATRVFDESDNARAFGLLALLSISAQVAVHYIGGLETGLYTTLAFAAVMTRLREQATARPAWSALIFSAVVLERPEGILLFAVMLVHDLGQRVIARRFRLSDLLFYLVPGSVYGAELALSKLYYGDPLPQTYYAKTHATIGLTDTLHIFAQQAGKAFQSSGSYLFEGLRGTGFPVAAFPLLLVAFVVKERRRQNLAFLLVSCAQLAFVVRVGDDWAPGFRFGVPALPFLFALAIEALAAFANLAGSRRQLASWVLVGIAVTAVLPSNAAASRDIELRRYVNADALLREGRSLASLAEPGNTISTFDIGGEGYAAGGFEIFDTFGLVTRETARCRHRPQCPRYAALVRPEIVRRHPGIDRDGFVADAVRKQEPYLELSGGRYLIRRSVVLLDRAPEDAIPVSAQRPAPELQVVAHDLPGAVRVGLRAETTLYWTAGDAVAPALQSRKLEWRREGEVVPAYESDVLWGRIGATDAWKTGEVFADHVVFRAPKKPGRYALVVQAKGSETQALTMLDVLDSRGAESRASQLLKRATAQGGIQSDAAPLQMLREAVLLNSSPETRRSYHERVVGQARALRSRAEAGLEGDHVAALRLLQDARRLALKAYWEAGKMTPRLRSEIDMNAARSEEIITSDLATVGRRSKPVRRGRHRNAE